MDMSLSQTLIPFEPSDNSLLPIRVQGQCSSSADLSFLSMDSLSHLTADLGFTWHLGMTGVKKRSVNLS